MQVTPTQDTWIAYYADQYNTDRWFVNGATAGWLETSQQKVHLRRQPKLFLLLYESTGRGDNYYHKPQTAHQYQQQWKAIPAYPKRALSWQYIWKNAVLMLKPWTCLTGLPASDRWLLCTGDRIRVCRWSHPCTIADDEGQLLLWNQLYAVFEVPHTPKGTNHITPGPMYKEHDWDTIGRLLWGQAKQQTS